MPLCEVMTLDEAIEHAYGVANDAQSDPSCAANHRQLAVWLEELRRLQQPVTMKKSRLRWLLDVLFA